MHSVQVCLMLAQTRRDITGSIWTGGASQLAIRSGATFCTAKSADCKLPVQHVPVGGLCASAFLLCYFRTQCRQCMIHSEQLKLYFVSRLLV